MNVPEDREYTHSHEWIRIDGESAVVGITANDRALTGERLRIEFPQEIRAVKAGDIVATITSAIGSRTICAPLSGSIVEINRELDSHPELMSRDPYGSGWLFRLAIEAGEEIEHLLDSSVYQAQLRASEALDIEVP